MGRCKYQVKNDGVHYCQRNRDAVGLCVGLCGAFEPIGDEVHRSVCKCCNQPLSSVESVGIAEAKIERLVSFINNSLTDHFDHGEAVCLVNEVTE